MKISIIGSTRDLRTNTPVLYAQMSIPDYLKLVGEDFAAFAIQRKREKHRAYVRMKNDIKKGALLPTITLAVNPEYVGDLLPLVDKQDFKSLEFKLDRPGSVNILDGLQRTYILQDLMNEGAEFPNSQTQLVEFWLEPQYRHLIYRIIVLNAGQKPMSMRHQIEVLFSTFKATLEKEIVGLELFQERDQARRSRAKKFALDRIVAAYQSFLTKSPEVQKENVVAQHLLEDDVLSDSEENLIEKYDQFKYYLACYSALDEEVCRIYDGDRDKGLPSGFQWFGSENVINAFFAAVADFGSIPERIERINNAIQKLGQVLKSAAIGSDPLGLITLLSIQDGFNPRRVNIGFATRKLMVSAFKEYFRDEGQRPLSEYWASEAE